ncbi:MULTISPECIES: hypothetical protein [Enterobacter cloacae complex]|uniref:hypothetical protein n=1 Tax=Enterobacter cloacae complex TaxID=354276 RepID=UPI0018C2B234|nr:hypothetical protein [Enterobacter asburiae]MBF9770427.1 hypothetical protein [Enterobacter asburiae]HDR2693187.1 hypothetical protein [Enterobacter bugandensis]HDS3779399.1 hypothetical protein [Enterobacter bugandensis]
MFLVKSCKQEHNLRVCGTLRIGTLQEYRDTYEQQILDKYEGTYRTHMKLSNVHLPIPFINYLFNNHHSHMSITVDKLSLGKKSAIWPGHLVIERHDSIVNYSSFNRFIFCISKLDNPNESTNIFEDYNSMWYFRFENVLNYAEIIRFCFLKEISKKLQNGEEIFTKKTPIKDLKLHFKIQEIVYTERNCIIDNRMIYTDTDSVVQIFDSIKFIKPKQFEKEKELRIVFDFFDGDELLYPVIKSIIINATPLMNFVTMA